MPGPSEFDPLPMPPGTPDGWGLILQLEALRREFASLRGETTQMAEAYRDMARSYETSDQLSHQTQQRALGLLSRVVQTADRIEGALKRLEVGLGDIPDHLRGIVEPYLLSEALADPQRECLALLRILAGRAADGSALEGALSPVTEILHLARRSAGLDEDTGKEKGVVETGWRMLKHGLVTALAALFALVVLLFLARLVMTRLAPSPIPSLQQQPDK